MKCKNCGEQIEQGLLGWYHVSDAYFCLHAESAPDESATEETIQFREEETYEGKKHPILLMSSGLFMFEKPEALKSKEKKEPSFSDGGFQNLSYKFSYGVSPVHNVKFKQVRTSGMQAIELTRKPNKDGK